MKILRYLAVGSIFFCNVLPQKYDLTVVGSLGFDNSISLLSVTTLYRHCDNLKVNAKGWLRHSPHNGDIPHKVLSILKNENGSIPGTVAFYTDIMQRFRADRFPKSPIKIALTMTESTRIPAFWANIINNHFDAIVVPDNWLIPVYQNCGVRKPIFVIPLSCFLDEFLEKPAKQAQNKCFRFGIATSILDAKNIFKLAQAFAQEFKEEEQVELHIIGGANPRKLNFEGFLKSLGTTRIKYNKSKVNRAHYVDFVRSLDCYVLISKGEGFSITPREALAAGIPCILTDNTAQKVICESGFVKSIPSNIAKQSAGEWYGKEGSGLNFDCKIEDVRAALRDVYQNYAHHRDLAHQGREWVKQYTHENLNKRYMSLFKPSKIILGDANEVTDDYFMTNSAELYKKYIAAFKS